MQVSKNVVYGVAVAFVGMIAVIFFLLGRESQHVRSRPPGGDQIRAAQDTTPSPIAPASPSVAVGAPPSMSTIAPASGAQGPAAAAPSGEAAAVRDYFTRMDAIQAFTGSTDAGEFANTVLAGAMKGDMSGFDNVLKLAQDGVERARAILPPPSCRSYHDNLLRLLGEGVDMLQQLTAALKSNDTGALTAIAVSGNALQARATALEAEGKAIKSRFGISN
jgi:hypothetical protein